MKLKSGWFVVVLFAFGFSTIFIVTGCASEAAARERKVTVPQSELPAVIRKAIKEAFPQGQIIKIEKEVEGEISTSYSFAPGQYDMDIRTKLKSPRKGKSSRSRRRHLKKRWRISSRTKNGRILSVRRVARFLRWTGTGSLFWCPVINWCWRVKRRKLLLPSWMKRKRLAM